MAARLASEPENCSAAAGHTDEPAHHCDACCVERVEVAGSSVGGPGELWRGHPAGPGKVVDLVPSLVGQADGFHPPVDVASPIGAGQPDVLADGEGDVTAAAGELVGDLDARG